MTAHLAIPPLTITNRAALDRMESAMMDARLYSLLLRSVINATGLELLNEDRAEVISEDDSEQITFLSLKLERATSDAFTAFQEVLA